MRCQFCGWENPDSKTTCEKCNQPLHVSADLGKSTIRESRTSAEESSRPTQYAESFNPKATVREKGSGLECAPAVCPNCGYNLDGESVCPVCGTDCNDSVFTREGEPGDLKKTIRPNHNLRFNKEVGASSEAAFNLVKIADSGEGLDNKRFTSEEVELNRDNTDPSNQTITSRIQAIVKKDGDRWVIVDKSELQSTFVQASRPIELRNGDILLLGDQLFRFESE